MFYNIFSTGDYIFYLIIIISNNCIKNNIFVPNNLFLDKKIIKLKMPTKFIHKLLNVKASLKTFYQNLFLFLFITIIHYLMFF